MMTSDVEFDLRALHRDYGDIGAEARSCRSTAALFDFSFMRRIRVRGPRASALVQTLTPRWIEDLVPGRIRYALRVGAGGRVLGDVTIWRLDAESFEVFAGTGDVLTQLQAAAGSTTSVRDLSEETAIFALQGPSSLRALAGVSSTARLGALPYFGHVQESVAGVACRVGRLGYTGERGFEIIVPRAARDAVWTMLAQHARPAGFAAADILRIEAGFPLFANELLFPVSAAELGLTRFAAEPDAPCRPPSAQRADPIRLVSFEAMCDRDPILWHPPRDATFPPTPGTLLATSACRSIITGAILGLGYARDAHGAARLFDPTRQFRDIREVSVPFYDPHKRRPRGGWRDDLSPEGEHHSFD
jgi:glycine cleavage system T protein (aminomethyltransferase)